MHVIRKKYTIEYAHQLADAFSDCCRDTIHGHSGVIEVYLESETLEDCNMVIDFGELSSWIEDYLMRFDHALIMPIMFSEAYIATLRENNQKLIVVDRNPTAEYMAEEIYWGITETLVSVLKHNHKRKLRLQKVRFHETETGYAEFTK